MQGRDVEAAATMRCSAVKEFAEGPWRGFCRGGGYNSSIEAFECDNQFHDVADLDLSLCWRAIWVGLGLKQAFP